MIYKILLTFVFASGVAMASLFPPKKLQYQPGDKIAIVGAGVSGFAVVKGLLDSGVPAENITVIERNALVGGKVKTVNHNGRPYELGAAVAIDGRYDEIIQLAEHHGITKRSLQPTKFMDTEKGIVLPDPDPNDPEQSAVLEKVQEQTISYLTNFQKLWMPILDWNGFSKIPADLDEMSWKDFLANYKGKYGDNKTGIELFNYRLSTALGGSGYVMMQDPPFAAQILRWISPSLLKSINTEGSVGVFNAVEGGKCSENLKGDQPTGGFQCLWIREAEELKTKGVNFKMSTEVVKIDRGRKGITLTLKSDDKKSTFRKFFDHTFYTADLRYLIESKWAKGLLNKPSDNESKLIGSISVYPYRSYLIELKSFPAIGASKEDEYAGIFGLLPHMKNGDDKKGVLMVKPYADTKVVKLYAFGGEEVDDADILASFKQDMEKLKIDFDAESGVIEKQQWQYFPHINPNSGITLSQFFNGMMECQGVGGLWFTGEVFGFGLTIDVYEQGQAFAKRFVNNEDVTKK